MTNYKAKTNGILNDKKAKIFGNRIEQLIKKCGGSVKPLDIIQDARSPKSPLHSFFDWNDDSAAEKWRLHQARMMLSQVMETVLVQGKQNEFRSFHNVRITDKETAYVTLKKVIDTPNYTQQLIDDAENYLRLLMYTLKVLRRRIK